MDPIVNRTRGTRSRTLSPEGFVTRTGGTYVPQTRTALGQGEDVSFFFPEEAPAPFTEAEFPGFGEVFPPSPPFVPIPEILREGSLPAPGETAGVQIVLRRGDRGDQVRGLQLQLRRLGFAPGRVDGIFGPLTEQAVRQFQQSLGLTATGLVDDVTWAALQSAVPGAVPPTPGAPAPVPRPPPAPRPEPTRTPPAEVQQVLGLPVGIWVALGLVVVALFATAAPGPRPAPLRPLQPAPARR